MNRQQYQRYEESYKLKVVHFYFEDGEDKRATLEEFRIDTEFYAYDGLSHGFGVCTGTIAEGWVNDAVDFWKRNHMAGISLRGSSLGRWKKVEPQVLVCCLASISCSNSLYYSCNEELTACAAFCCWSM